MRTAKDMVGNRYQVTNSFKIGNCKMKIGDIIKVHDYGYSSVADTVSFKNERLPFYNFSGGAWFIKQNTQEATK